MEQPDDVENLEADAAVDGQGPEGPNGLQDTTPVDLLRIKEQMFNQCVEISAQINAVENKITCSTSEAEYNLADNVTALEETKTEHFIKTLALHRMQMGHAIAEKLQQNNPESESIKAVNDRCMALCSQIKDLQQESRDMGDQITDIRKKRLELKQLTRDQMKEMELLKKKYEHPEFEKYKAAQQKGQSNIEKYKTMTVLTQNVLRGIILACKINWLDDPKLKDIGMTLEDLPITD
ncbi:centromere protein H [Gadus chalcogrammus]|uniref:centromere protein H n=1 Tax=Gadus chalcogrammus TaxID=1042646 RepID=UPI0024C40DBB|nr:centromere protein H [Gadus chalcogrammus]